MLNDSKLLLTRIALAILSIAPLQAMAAGFNEGGVSTICNPILTDADRILNPAEKQIFLNSIELAYKSIVSKTRHILTNPQGGVHLFVVQQRMQAERLHAYLTWQLRGEFTKIESSIQLEVYQQKVIWSRNTRIMILTESALNSYFRDSLNDSKTALRSNPFPYILTGATFLIENDRKRNLHQQLSDRLLKVSPSLNLQSLTVVNLSGPDNHVVHIEAQNEGAAEISRHYDRDSERKLRLTFVENLARFEEFVRKTPEPRLRTELRYNQQLYAWHHRLRKNSAKSKLQIPYLLVFSQDVRKIMSRVFPEYYTEEVLAQSTELGARSIPIEYAFAAPYSPHQDQGSLLPSSIRKLAQLSEWVRSHSVEEVREHFRNPQSEFCSFFNNLKSRDHQWMKLLDRDVVLKLLQTGRHRLTETQQQELGIQPHQFIYESQPPLRNFEETVKVESEDSRGDAASPSEPSSPSFFLNLASLERLSREYSEASLRKMINRSVPIYKFLYRLRFPDRPFLRTHWLLIFDEDIRKKFIQIFSNEIPQEIIQQSEALGKNKIPLSQALPVKSYLQKHIPLR